MTSWLTRHWEVKLVSLVLAVIIFFLTGRMITEEAVRTVRLDGGDVIGLPESYQVESIIPREFSVTLSGPASVLVKVRERDIRPRLTFDMANPARREQVFDITAQTLLLDPDLRLERCSAPGITVRIERILRGQILPIADVPELLDLPQGLVVVSIVLSRAQVVVSGPEGMIETLAKGKIPLRPIRLGHVDPALAEPREFTVPLVLAVEAKIREEDPDRVPLQAIITIGPAPLDKAVTVPLRWLESAEFHRQYLVEDLPERITLSVRGPRNRLEMLKPEESLLAYVDLTGKPTLDIPQDCPVRVLSPPPWLTVLPPPPVRATVRARPQPTPVGGSGGATPPPKAAPQEGGPPGVPSTPPPGKERSP